MKKTTEYTESMQLLETHSTKEPSAKTEKSGMGVTVTALYAVGLMTGTGVLAIPYAMTQTGVTGFALLALCEVVCIYTSSLLSRSMAILQHRHEEYRGRLRHPYPALGMVTYGRFGRVVVSFCANVTMFGSAVVYLILSAEYIQNLVSYFNDTLSFCWWLVAIAVVLWPFTWLGTPKDFWPKAVIAAIVTIAASYIITANVIVDAPNVAAPSYDPITLTGYLSGIGTILFGHRGHASFPNIQIDMQKPRKFVLAVSIAFTIMFFTYGPVSLAGYLVYGSALDQNILDTVSSGALSIIAQVFLTLHFLSGFGILLNPVCQEGEEVVGVPKNFGYQRVLFRTAVMILVWFTAASIPEFSFIMSLVGGSTITALSIVAPPILYLKLCSMKGNWDPVVVPLHEKVACIQIIIVGLAIIVAVTYSSLLSVISDDFSKPCYLS